MVNKGDEGDKTNKRIIRLLEEYEVKEPELEEEKAIEDIIEEERKEDIDEDIDEEIVADLEERKLGRPRLTGKEKIERALERKLAKQKLEEEYKKKPRTPYTGGTPDLKDSGGWCLEESKTVMTVIDRRTGVQKTTINGLEVEKR